MSLPVDVPQMDIDTYLLELEQNLMTGSARWIADFTESFRDFPISGERFDMVVKGNTRPKRGLLSKLFAYLSLPDYSVGSFVYSKKADRSKLDELIRLVLEHMRENNVAWSWLVVLRHGSFSQEMKDLLREKEVNEIGIALVDTSSGQIATSPSYVGRSMVDHLPKILR